MQMQTHNTLQQYPKLLREFQALQANTYVAPENRDLGKVPETA
jgi:hypothetical protein